MQSPEKGDSEAVKKLKSFQKEAFKLISQAIDNEEAKGSTTKSIDYYKSGIAKLKQGLAIKIDSASDRSNRYREIQTKMQRNLVMAEERMSELIKLQENDKDKIIVIKRTQPKSLPTIPSIHPAPPPPPRPPVGRQISNPAAPRTIAPISTKAPVNGNKNLTERIKNVDKELAKKILDEVLDQAAPVTFDDIVGNENAKSALQEMVIYPTKRPDLFTDIRAPPRGLLLFGPPGNGKTLLAKAVAYESGCVFFNISAATLVSKWVGEAEKLVRALFAMARELQPAIVFIDEVDSLLSARRSDDKDSSRRLLTQFLQEFDGVASNDNERVVIIAATNCPQDLDEAALRRLPKRLFISMPETSARLSMIEYHLRGLENKLSNSDLHKLAELTENYSASDLKHLVKDAAMAPLREIKREDLLSVDKQNLRIVDMVDFYHSLKRIKPSLSSETMQRYLDWAHKHAQTA